MKYYVIAGEASGDLHASKLVKALKEQDPEAQFKGWGGDLMQNNGVEIVKHYKDLAFMGFVEVLANLKTIFGNIRFCKKDILNFKPDALILIDYPGFNLRIAKFAHKAGIKVFYYIAPQVWAWHQSRVKAMRRDIDKLFVILPFEKDFFQNHGLDAEFVGHPLLDTIQHPEKSIKKQGKPIVALLPGSRKQEIEKTLPIFLNATLNFPDYQFIVAGVKTQSNEFYHQYMKDYPDVKLIFSSTYSILNQAYAALVTSGTATLETALHKVPQIVCYKGNSISYFLAQRFIKVKYVSLVNLIVDRLLVKELIQKDLNECNLKQELNVLLKDEVYRSTIDEGYNELIQKLGKSGASETTARLILKELH